MSEKKDVGLSSKKLLNPKGTESYEDFLTPKDKIRSLVANFAARQELIEVEEEELLFKKALLEIEKKMDWNQTIDPNGSPKNHTMRSAGVDSKGKYLFLHFDSSERTLNLVGTVGGTFPYDYNFNGSPGATYLYQLSLDQNYILEKLQVFDIEKDVSGNNLKTGRPPFLSVSLSDQSIAAMIKNHLFPLNQFITLANGLETNKMSAIK